MRNKKSEIIKKKSNRKRKDNVFQEAWKNMNRDINKLLPEKMRDKNKKQFVLWLFILELLILGTLGKFLYDWFTG